MIAAVPQALRASWRRPTDRWFLVSTVAITTLALFLRLPGLSHGSLYRDDAWVALTSRVPWHDAWRMVGTGPGYVVFERWWVGLTAPSTWWAQLPTLFVSILAIPVMAVVARWWGLSRAGALLATVLLAVSPIDVAYATHLKPYAHDVLAALLILAAAEWWRRGHSPWPFAVLSLVSVATSFSVAPVVVGCAGVMCAASVRRRGLRHLLIPLTAMAVPLGVLYLVVRSGISPRLHQSWSPNFVSYRSVHSVVHSLNAMMNGLFAGFSDTRPHWHITGFSKLLLLFLLSCVVAASWTRERFRFPAAAIVTAVLLAAVHVAPLGTGRTDAYLYPALALLVGLGADYLCRIVRPLPRGSWLQWAFVVVVIAGVVFTVGDQLRHRPTYPGGSIAPVAAAAHAVESHGGGVLIEGTARWPWTYYEARHVVVRFSPLYNTGFAPVSTDRHVVVMPGTIIEGGYSSAAAVAAVSTYSTVLYVRTDDWPSMGNPLAGAFRRHCFHERRRQHVAGYLMVWLSRSCPTR